MKIAVCVKAVPNRAVQMNADTGHIERGQAGSILNMYDYAAVEAALRVKEALGGEVTAITMGPPPAETVLREVVALGADHAVLVCDAAFRGADVLATSYTLAQALKALGGFSLVVCGKQSTDGDTAQVAGALAAQLELAYLPWVQKLHQIDPEGIQATCHMGGDLVSWFAPFPFVMSVEPSLFLVRAASLAQKLKSRKQEIQTLGKADFPAEEARLGAAGSPTRVVGVQAREAKQMAECQVVTAKEALWLIEQETQRLQGETR